MKTIKNETDRANLIQRLNKLNGSEKALWGKMNVNQMVSHLVQAGEMPFGHSLEDKGNFVTKNIVKPLVLYILPMPKEVKTSPDMNQQENGRKPLEFAEDKKSVINLAEKLGNLSADFQCFQHPIFGKMNAREWGLLAHKHVDHHLKQFGV
jgi:predicted oxidoreductase (fatty acid repression mutant protein)